MKIKKVISAILAAVTVISLPSCKSADEEKLAETNETVFEYQPQEQKKFSAPQLSYTPHFTDSEVLFHYLNNDNIVIISDKITLAPVEIYYKDYTFSCVCRIYNGYDEPISHISLDWFNLSCSSGDIAHHRFGEIADLTISPHDTAIQTFTFSEGDIEIIPKKFDDIECEYYFSCERQKSEEQKKKDEKLRSMLSPSPNNIYVDEYAENSKRDGLSFVPILMYYKKDKFYVKYRIFNNYSSTVTKIWMQWLKIYCNKKLIAEKSFGLIEDLSIAPSKYADYCFVFDYDNIVMYDEPLQNPSASIYYYYSSD